MHDILALMLKGLFAGLAAAGLIAGTAWIASGTDWGFATLAVGSLTGGLVLFMALGMSGLSYFMALRERSATLRRRLLSLAIFCGTAGMSCETAAVMLWALTALPA